MQATNPIAHLYSNRSRTENQKTFTHPETQSHKIRQPQREIN